MSLLYAPYTDIRWRKRSSCLSTTTRVLQYIGPQPLRSPSDSFPVAVERKVFNKQFTVVCGSTGPTAGVRHALTVIAKAAAAAGQTVTAGAKLEKIKNRRALVINEPHHLYTHEYNVYIAPSRIEGWSFLTGAHLLCVIGGRNKSLGEYLSTRSPPPQPPCPTRSRRVPPTPSNNDVFIYYIYTRIYVPGPLRRRRSFVFKQFR